jgi:hypothetical protein
MALSPWHVSIELGTTVGAVYDRPRCRKQGLSVIIEGMNESLGTRAKARVRRYSGSLVPIHPYSPLGVLGRKYFDIFCVRLG